MADPVTIGITLALTAAQMAMGAMRKIEGPRLDSLNVTLADYGTPLEDFWGIRRLKGRPIVWAEKLREKKKKSKTKGGKFSEYKYYGTWAVAIAGHEIDAVTRIWLDKHPVYQMTGEGPVAALILTAIDPEARDSIKVSANNMAIYLGTEDQLPDPRIESWCEDRYGVGSASAYRGTSYIVFKDIPLEKFGNRIPQVDVEAVRVKTASFPYETRTTTRPTGIWFFGGGFGIFVDGGFIEWWDTATRTNLGTSPAYGVLVGSTTTVIGSDGMAYGVGTSSPPPAAYLIRTGPLATPILDAIDSPASLFFSNIRVFGSTAYIAYNDAEGYVRHTTHIPDAAGLRGRDFAVNDNGEVCVLMQPSGSSDQFVIRNTTDNSEISFTALSTRSGPNNSRFCITKWGKWFVDDPEGEFYIVNPETGVIEVSGSAGWAQPAFLNAQTNGSTSLWDFIGSFDEYSLEDGSLIRSYSPFDWVFANTTSHSAYDPVTHAIWSEQSSSSNIHVRYLDRIGSGGLVLGTIVDDDSDRVNVSADVAALDQPVVGYSTTPGTVRERIEHLLDAHDSICRTHDFGVQYIKRGTSSQGVIDVTDFVRDGDSARYTVEIDQDTELPVEVSVKYADSGNDQQTNTVTARRATDAVDSVRNQQLDLTTYVGTPDDMQKLADRWLRRKWNSRATVNNGLTAQYLAAEAGDIYDLDLDGVLWTVELEKLTLANGALQCGWRRTFPSLNALGDGTGPDMDGRDEDPIIVPGPTKGFVLDIPLVTDVDSNSNPLLYYAAGSFGTGNWLGGSILEGDLDGEEYSEWNAVDSSSEALWGITTDTLADVPTPWLWDRGNTVNVRVFGGTLSTVTEADIDADASTNLCYLNGELLNFATATLETDGTYTLSDFKRGRRGTEWATGDHATGDEFLLLSSAFNDGMGVSEVGNHLFFKAQSFGRDPDMAPAIELDYSGASLKPYAPARINWTTDGTDLFGEIIRRTRVGGSWVGGSTIPLSENSEEYEVDVMDGADVVRTIVVTGTNTFTYTAAQIGADGNTVDTPPSVNAYQLSDAVGRGFALAA